MNYAGPHQGFTGRAASSSAGYAQALQLTPMHVIAAGHAVAMVYLRAGYAPTDYPSEAEWDGRLMIERSNAVKCVTACCHVLARNNRIRRQPTQRSQIRTQVG